IKHCVVWFDADKLDKIVYNLLSNAFKFTPVNGRIAVELSIFESSSPPGFSDRKDIPLRYIRVVVRDSGIGIPEDKLEHIFERHYRVEADSGESYEGSGIGLALVAELIDLYQGKIAVESAAGKGAAFTVDIPVDEIFLEETQLVGEFSTPEDQQANSYLFPGLDEKGSTMDDNLSNTAISRDMPVVLVVEDDDEIRNFIKTSLQDEYRTFDAANGKAGFAKATELVPDLIISDVKMPGVSGVQLCNHLKQDERTSHIPIILLTAFSSHETKIEGLMEGADVYLTKPFSIVELRVRISNLLQNRQRLKETFLRQMLVEPGRLDSQSQNVNEEFLNRVIETVEKHLSDNKFNAEKLSREIGMSRMQLYRKIRGVTNLTVHEFIRTIRLKKAAQLLQQKRMTITEVAYEVGFNDLTYFARCFRKQYDKSPSEFISG
ncbi:MAG TPA: response regulator, partial [Calditrichia bacterium]|nr:response regulator [Calditrichia bacterium]